MWKPLLRSACRWQQQTNQVAAGAVAFVASVRTLTTRPSREALEAYYSRHAPSVEKRIEELVTHESPTSDTERVARLGNRLAALWEEELGARLTYSSHAPPVIRAQVGDAHPRICCVFHHDTVWPVSSFRNSGRHCGQWYGPGIFDMKANIPLVTLSMRYLVEHAPDIASRILLVSSPDEETQGIASREGVHALAKGCRNALVFEPPRADGAFKDRRKGVGRVWVNWEGKATHSGNQYVEGISALAAAARLLLAAEAQSRCDEGFTINVGLMSGGSAANTRPGSAQMEIDVRFTDELHYNEFFSWLSGYQDPAGARANVTCRPVTPPMQASGHDLWPRLEVICKELDLPFSRGMAGGASDGCHLAAHGLSVMDGLGVAGGGEHAEHEHILLDALPMTFVRNTMLLYQLAGDE